MTAPMNPADVPHELIEAFERAALMSILHEDVRPSRYILAAVGPLIRAQVADEIRAARPSDPYDSRHDGMEHAEHIARGDQ